MAVPIYQTLPTAELPPKLQKAKRRVYNGYITGGIAFVHPWIHPQSRYLPTETYGTAVLLRAFHRVSSIFGAGFSPWSTLHTPTILFPPFTRTPKYQNIKYQNTNIPMPPAFFDRSMPPVKGVYNTIRWSVPTPIKKTRGAVSTENSDK